ncbi:MAG: BadF/BadG/BcrA/BcrD ATPase family protein [Pseudomonadota bacterium]
MTTPDPSTALGIDCGASTCRFALQLGARRIEVETSGANATTDHAAVVATLRDGLAQLAQAAGQPLTDIPAFAGVAGLKNADAAGEIAAALPLERIEIGEDRLPAVVGALGQREGSVAAIGTGSFLGRQRAQGIRFAGGWGLAVGDDASGGWLGREVLALALRAEDGLVPHSDLTRSVLGDLGGAQGAVAFAATAKPRDYGAKPRVRAIIDAAASGDGNAIALMQRGAVYITDALTALGHPATDPLCLIGSVAPHYRPYLSPDLTIIRPNGTPLDGALALAARMGRDAADPEGSA